MPSILELISHTPIWVYALFLFLVSRGIRALKPAEVALGKLAIVPGCLSLWSIHDIVQIYGISVGSVVPWIGAALVGALFGWMLIENYSITIDRARGMISRPADYSVLPLILSAFAFKYTFAIIGAVSPEVLLSTAVRLLDLTVSGLIAGIFVGKFGCYAKRYFGTPVLPQNDGFADVGSVR